MQEMIGLVLNIFLQMNELGSLECQLNQIERLLVVYPALSAMVSHFQKVSSPLASASFALTSGIMPMRQVLWEKKQQRRPMFQQQGGGSMPSPMNTSLPLASTPPINSYPHHMQQLMPHMVSQISPMQIAQMSPQQSLAQVTSPQVHLRALSSTEQNAVTKKIFLLSSL